MKAYRLANSYRDGTPFPGLDDVPFALADAAGVETLLAQCPAHAETPLAGLDELAAEIGVAALHVKDERRRMELGSFKALGAAHVLARHAVEAEGDPVTALAGRTYITASAGNHGLSVAAGARVFGARAIIYLAQTVPADFIARLEQKGATVRVHGADYDASMAAALAASENGEGELLSDSSWPGYTASPHILMEGYLAMAAEMVRQMSAPPTHLFLQAGVGGLAGAVAAHARKVWGDAVTIVVVEPDRAPALVASIEEGKVGSHGDAVSNMGRLDCKEPSLIALKTLARDADHFVTITDEEAQAAVDRLADHDMASTPSGVAGVAALLNAEICKYLSINAQSRALAIISEAAL